MCIVFSIYLFTYKETCPGTLFYDKQEKYYMKLFIDFLGFA